MNIFLLMMLPRTINAAFTYIFTYNSRADIRNKVHFYALKKKAGDMSCYVNSLIIYDGNCELKMIILEFIHSFDRI